LTKTELRRNVGEQRTPQNILGVLSLVIYSLLLVISIKYIAIVMRADNQGRMMPADVASPLPVVACSTARQAHPIVLPGRSACHTTRSWF
jgi:hypothetical protein